MAHEILFPSFMRTDDRGMFVEVLNDGTWQALVSGRMNPEAVMGNHYHRKTVVFFFLATGAARIKTVNVETAEKDDFMLRGGQGVVLKVNESHSIRFQELSDFIMLKSQRYDPAEPDTYQFPVED